MTRLRVVRSGAPSTRRTLRALVAVAACAVAASAAIGWLYLLRDARALHAGPAVGGALPLQRLAGQDGQPALPFLLAWAPAGLAAGAALGWATRLPAVARAGVAGAVAFVVLFATGALADAVTASQSPWAHITPQLGRGALWLGAATMAAGAALHHRANAPRSSRRLIDLSSAGGRIPPDRTRHRDGGDMQHPGGTTRTRERIIALQILKLERRQAMERAIAERAHSDPRDGGDARHTPAAGHRAH